VAEFRRPAPGLPPITETADGVFSDSNAEIDYLLESLAGSHEFNSRRPRGLQVATTPP